jgi:hypothetical protein
MLEDASHRPAIRARRLITQMRGDAVDRCAQAGARSIETGEYVGKRWMHGTSSANSAPKRMTCCSVLPALRTL